LGAPLEVNAALGAFGDEPEEMARAGQAQAQLAVFAGIEGLFPRLYGPPHLSGLGAAGEGT
ncbi:MAG TPA: hypothetical protein DFS52_21050, partial [Myxococcales bacterium]|nr:hypothetical protein [Myxococcales bacterium]